MRAAPTPGRRIPAALALLLCLLLTPGMAIAGDATPQAVTDPGDSNAESAPSRNTPRIVEFVTVPPSHCGEGGVIRGIVGLQHPTTQPVRVQITLTAIERATGREIEVDEHTVPAAGSIAFSLEGDFSGGLTGFVARVRLLDASNTTLQSRFNPVHLPCADPDPGPVVNLPVTGAGSGKARPIAAGLVALAATIVFGYGGALAARNRPLAARARFPR
jgi:hypothetical protein